MHLQYTLDAKGAVMVSNQRLALRATSWAFSLSRAAGTRIYTLKKKTVDGKLTKSAHPARFSPDDKFSRHRVTIKRRHGVLLTQLPAKPY